MKQYIYTDLALERAGNLLKDKKGISEYTEEKIGDNLVCRLEIDSAELAEKYGRDPGTYVTVYCGKLWLAGKDDRENLASLLAEEIRNMAEKLTGKKITPEFRVLVAGLGNIEITPDAIGPKTVQKLTVTRHVTDNKPLFDALGSCSVAALSPGVLGQTGIETVEFVRGAAENTKPDVVIAVDALASRSLDRLASTIQLSNRGINPGSGIGNLRKAITEENIGAPVIAVGVPTVVDSATLVCDALERAGIEVDEEKLSGVLDNERRFFVAPKESDIVTQAVAELLSAALDEAFYAEK